jgi:hypothetical protein
MPQKSANYSLVTIKNNAHPTKLAGTPFVPIGMAVHPSRYSERRLNEEFSGAFVLTDASDEQPPTRPSTPTDMSSSIRPKSPITYLSRTPTKSEASLDDRRSPSLPAKSSPKKLVKDLSALFEFASVSDSAQTAPSPPRNTGVAKRMLSRSRTVSSIGNSNSSGSLESIKDESHRLSHDRTDTIIDLTIESSSASSNKSLSPAKPTKCDDPSSPPIKPHNFSIRTYAGSSRSFLVTLPASQIVASNLQSLDDAEKLLESQEDLEVHETYSDLRARWGVDNSEDDPYPLLLDDQSSSGKRKGKFRETRPPTPISNGTSNDLKSITELRNKGESRRFQDEVGYLFEGLDPGSNISVRRGRCVSQNTLSVAIKPNKFSALEIITKLSDVEFARKAKVADFTVQAWEALREAGAGDGDKVYIDSYFFFTVA